jgi:hypothetical protein
MGHCIAGPAYRRRPSGEWLEGKQAVDQLEDSILQGLYIRSRRSGCVAQEVERPHDMLIEE